MNALDLFRTDLEQTDLDDLQIVADRGGTVDNATLRRLLDSIASARAAMDESVKFQDEAIGDAIKEALEEAGDSAKRLARLLGATRLLSYAPRKKVLRAAFGECSKCRVGPGSPGVSLEDMNGLCNLHGKVVPLATPRKLTLIKPRRGKNR